MDYAGRSVVLTGVGREGQVGEAVAAAFAERGARVFLVSRQEADARERADALLARGRRAAGLGADLTDETAVAALAERIRDATGGRVHALVHMAGGFASSGPVVDSDAALFARQFAINTTTAMLTARAFLPLLRATRGAMVFFASEAVLPGGRTAGISAYAASKSALVALM
ncbi:MAG: SDR family oxidoreductase, partial [bacterium]